MSASTVPTSPTLPTLPHWEETPADLPAAIREIKAALRARIAASGRTVEETFAAVEQRIKAEVDEITTAHERGETVWPVIDYTDIAAGRVSAEDSAKLRRRGCLVVRGHFDEFAVAHPPERHAIVEVNRARTLFIDQLSLKAITRKDQQL